MSSSFHSKNQTEGEKKIRGRSIMRKQASMHQIS